MCRAKNPLPAGRERILLVDDEVAVIKMTQKKLEKLGYEVKSTTNPADALHLVKTQPDLVDLLITDMVMPQMTGAQLAESLLKIKPDLPVILCTGYSTISEQEALDIGIFKLVQKPFELNCLAIYVRQAIDSKHYISF